MTNGGRARRWSLAAVTLLSAVWLGVSERAGAASPAGPRVPPRPPDGVHDDARLFSEEQRRAAAQAIADAKTEGVAVYLATFTFIADETIEHRAERLKSAWCGDEIGLIVVVDASTSQCTYLSHLAERDWLSSTQLRQVFEEATAVSVSKPTAGERLLSVVQNLVPRIRSALAARRAAVQNPGSIREWMVFGGVVVACGILLLGAWAGRRLGRRVRSRRPEPAFFPSAAVEPRFGAAFAGGVAAELDFRSVVVGGADQKHAEADARLAKGGA